MYWKLILVGLYVIVLILFSSVPPTYRNVDEKANSCKSLIATHPQSLNL